MTIRPDNLPWRTLWDYVCLWEDPPEEGENGLRPEPGDEDLLETGLRPEEDELEDGPGEDEEDDIGDFPFEEDEDGKTPIGDEEGDGPGFGITEPEFAPEKQIPGYGIIKNPNGSVDHIREFDS